MKPMCRQRSESIVKRKNLLQLKKKEKTIFTLDIKGGNDANKLYNRPSRCPVDAAHSFIRLASIPSKLKSKKVSKIQDLGTHTS